MAKNNVADLLSVGSLFTTQAERDEAQRETVRDIPLEEISDFPNHPFKVRMDESMMEMVDSVKQYGVLVPALVRPKPDGGYEMIAGHRRRMASELAEKPTLSCIVRDTASIPSIRYPAGRGVSCLPTLMCISQRTDRFTATLPTMPTLKAILIFRIPMKADSHGLCRSGPCARNMSLL